MKNETYQGVVRGGMVAIREHQTPLMEGAEVLVTPVTGAPSSAAAILAAVGAAPCVPTEWVDELERLIAEGRRPPSRLDPFLNGLGSQESR